MTTGVYLLRAAELGLSNADMDEITMGMFADMCTERGNDSFRYDTLATKEDYYNF